MKNNLSHFIYILHYINEKYYTQKYDEFIRTRRILDDKVKMSMQHIFNEKLAIHL